MFRKSCRKGHFTMSRRGRMKNENNKMLPYDEIRKKFKLIYKKAGVKACCKEGKKLKLDFAYCDRCDAEVPRNGQTCVCLCCGFHMNMPSSFQ